MRQETLSRVNRCWLTAGALACCSVVAEAQDGVLGTGGIRGLIRDTQGQAIIGAQIAISGSRLLVESDDSGRFELAKVKPGMLTLRFRRLGFEPDTVELLVLAGKTIPLDVRLRRVDVSLTPVVITGRSDLTGWREGFYHRRNAGAGHYFTAADIEKRNPRLLTDMFRALPGVTVQSSRGIIRNQLRFRNKACPPIVWLDGAPLTAGEFDIDVITPFSVAGVEIYTGSIVPPNFVTPLHTNSCGAVVIWSKEPPPRARNKDPRAASAASEIAKLVENRQIFTAAQVDVTARQDSLRPVRPKYPDDLYDAQVGGSVMVEFIVTASGEVDPDRISVVFATHPGFVDPVRVALETAKYVPALRGNYPVHQYVQREFHFVPDTTRRRR